MARARGDPSTVTKEEEGGCHHHAPGHRPRLQWEPGQASHGRRWDPGRSPSSGPHVPPLCPHSVSPLVLEWWAGDGAGT